MITIEDGETDVKISGFTYYTDKGVLLKDENMAGNLREASAVISHNIITNNTADYGAGIYARSNMFWHSTVIMENNMITDNTSESSGGGIYSALWQ